MPAEGGAPLFYQADLGGGSEIVLADTEARHVAAQRLRAGDAVAVFDGRGHFIRGRVASIARTAVRIRIAERAQAPPPRPALELYSAVPKGDRQAVLLDMATQLGLTRFVPLAWARGVVAPGARAAERWRRICIEACKQSRRLHVPEIGPSLPLAKAVAEARARQARLLLAHIAPDAEAVSAHAREDTKRYALFIGPEGGVTAEEAELLRAHGAGMVTLGEAVLRVETAAVALLALVRAATVAAG